MNQPTKSIYPCFCAFWQQECANCRLARSLDPQGEEIECVPVVVEPVRKWRSSSGRKHAESRANQHASDGEEIALAAGRITLRTNAI